MAWNPDDQIPDSPFTKPERKDVRRVVRDMRLRTAVAPLAPVIEQPKPKPTFSWLADPAAEPLPEIVRPPEAEIVYHYTTSASLPFILGRKLVHDCHGRDLHATESRNGEKTDTGAYRLANRGEDPVSYTHLTLPTNREV